MTLYTEAARKIANITFFAQINNSHKTGMFKVNTYLIL